MLDFLALSAFEIFD